MGKTEEQAVLIQDHVYKIDVIDDVIDVIAWRWWWGD